MNDWETRSMGELVELQRGHDLPTADRQPGNIPIIGSFGITGSHCESKYAGPGVGIGRSGAAIGQATFVDGPYWPLNTCLFVRDFRGNDPRWIFHLLDFTDFSQYNSGSAQPSLNRNFLRDIPVAVPPVAEQQAIAEILGALDDKIAANTSLVETADQLAGALTRRALDPSDVSPLTALAELTMGSSPAGTSYNDVGEGTVFYQGIRDFGVRYPENRLWTTSPIRMAKRRDTLLSVRAPVGSLNLAAEETCIGRGLASLRSLNGTPFTLFHALKDSPGVWAPFEAEGTVFGSINKKQLESLEIPNIPVQLVDQLETELAALEATIENAIVEKSSLTRTRDALLPHLMSAKLHVKDAEDLVSEDV